MTESSRAGLWAALLVTTLVAVGVGFAAYDVGLSHGLARSGQAVAVAQVPAAPGTTPVIVYPYMWHRPWGFGLFAPFFVFVLFFVLLRGLFWGGPWRRRWHDGRGLEEWHRRAHERMNAGQPSH